MIWGISIYPDKGILQNIIEYVNLAADEGAKRIFLNYIDILEQKNKEVENNFRKIISIAKKRNMIVVLDINESTCIQLRIDMHRPNLEYFKDLGVDVIRLDQQFNGNVEAMMAMNDQGISVELNASLFNNYIENVMSYGVQPGQVTACHNFYPQKYTGLDYEKYVKYTKKIQALHIQVGTFITLQNEKTQGPWEVFEKLPTLEIHRNLPIRLQANHLIANGLADYILISTQFATKKDFEELKKGLKFKKIIPFDKHPKLSEVEQNIIDYNFHFLRGDMSENVIRSTNTRKVFSNEQIIKRSYSEKIFKRGTILIPNNTYDKYKGELQIVTKDIENDGKRNVVGFIKPEHHFLIETITPWSHFELYEN